MPEINDPELGTPRENRVMYAIQQTGSRLIGDQFIASYLIDYIDIAEDSILTKRKNNAGKRNSKHPSSQMEDNIKKLKEIKSEDYHRVNVLAFLSLWSAHESGIENIIAAALGSIQKAAIAAAAKFKSTQYAELPWPWCDQICLEVAQKLDQKAKNDMPESDRGWDIAARLKKIFLWLGVEIEIPTESAASLNEASMVRNVLLHRYGRLGPRDIERAPHLVESDNKSIKITRPRLRQYSDAVRVVNVSIMNGVAKAGWA